MRSFLELDSTYWEPTSDESKEMHMHIDGKQNEKILSHIMIQHVGT